MGVALIPVAFECFQPILMRLAVAAASKRGLRVAHVPTRIVPADCSRQKEEPFTVHRLLTHRTQCNFLEFVFCTILSSLRNVVKRSVLLLMVVVVVVANVIQMGRCRDSFWECFKITWCC